MKVLIVSSGNSGHISPFVLEQGNSLNNLGIDLSYFKIIGKGIVGYLKNLKILKKKIKEFKPDLIHAHYGLSGLLACLQQEVPVIITFHGSDVNVFYVRLFSILAARLSAFNIFVEEKIKNNIKNKNKNKVIPCGIELETFYPIEKNTAKKLVNLNCNKQYILFSSNFTNKVKNFKLAQNALSLLNTNFEVIELKNKSREEVNLLLNACDIALLTSISEGSPQFIKEAMSCNCPIVATDVGDIRDITKNIDGCFITSFEPTSVAEAIKKAMEFSEKNKKTKGRDRIIQLKLDSESIAKEIINIYQNILE